MFNKDRTWPSLKPIQTPNCLGTSLALEVLQNQKIIFKTTLNVKSRQINKYIRTEGLFQNGEPYNNWFGPINVHNIVLSKNSNKEKWLVLIG